MIAKRVTVAALSLALAGVLAFAQTAPKSTKKSSAPAKGAKSTKPAMDRMGKPHDPSDEQFLKAAYRCLLAREAGPDDIGIWKPKLKGDGARHKIYGEIFGSAEYQALKRNDADFVQDAYRAYFGREADPVGLQTWTSALTRGTTRAKVLDELAASEEYRFPGGRFVKPCAKGEELVQQIYRTVLHREADAGGLSGHVSRLQKGESREVVLKDFFLSEEYAKGKPTDEVFLQDAYRACLGREGDSAGVQGYLGTLRQNEKDWKTKLGGGGDAKRKAWAQVLDTMLASEEYKKARQDCK